MRELLFRGKKTENSEWVYGGVCNFDSGVSIFEVQNFNGSIDEPPSVDLNEFDVDQNTVGQYIGLTDVNGVKVFEGDIVKVEHRYYMASEQYSRDIKLFYHNYYLGKIEYLDFGFCIRSINGHYNILYVSDLTGIKDGSTVLGNAAYSHRGDRNGWFFKTEDTVIGGVVGNIYESDLNEMSKEIDIENERLRAE